MAILEDFFLATLPILLGMLVTIVLWIVSIAKAFKAGDNVWGVANLITFFSGILYFMVKREYKLAIIWCASFAVGAGFYLYRIVQLASLHLDSMPEP